MVSQMWDVSQGVTLEVDGNPVRPTPGPARAAVLLGARSLRSCLRSWAAQVPQPPTAVRPVTSRPAAATIGQVTLPSGVKALTVINIPSYSGGANLWGSEDSQVRARPRPRARDSSALPACRDAR